MSKSIEEKYQKKTHHQHILEIPDTYIGSVDLTEETLWVINNENKFEKKAIKYVPGLYKIYDEIIVNARDHSIRTDSCTTIKINISNDSISVWNDGDGIEVAIHKEYNIYVPELIFGHLLTSSNYDREEKRIVGGKNGYGAKLTNIFSSEFVIETIDKNNKLKYKQVFKNNMLTKEEPEIKKVKSSEQSYTCITFKPDYSRFGLKELSEDMLALMRKRVYDIAACSSNKVIVYLNDEIIQIKSFREYINHYYPESEPVYDEFNRWKIGLLYKPNHGFEQITYVNGICTYKGGTHVHYLMDQIVKNLDKYLKKKQKELDIKPAHIKENLVLFVDSIIENPSFSSQTKEELTSKVATYGSECSIDENFIKRLCKTGIIDYVIQLAKLKEQAVLKKTDGKKSSTLRGVPKLEDANWAGTSKSPLCHLILTEGDSAKAFAMSGLSIIGRDRYGIFPLKGKLLNVREATPKQLQSNEEIINLKKILGLQHDKQYTDTTQLRYGGIVILTDQDVDGSHIKGLIINFIHHFWPSLLKMKGFIQTMATPILKATKGKQQMSFYTVQDYDKWKKETIDSNKWSIKYYKGLGTSTRDEAKDYFKKFADSMINYIWDEQSLESITLAFAKKRANDRKTWLLNYDYSQSLDCKDREITYNDFIHKDLIHFSKDDNDRSLPHLCDGLKVSQRKILFGCLKRELYHNKKEIKVAQLSGYVSDKSCYHHGEQSLMGAIIGMSQNFVGANNINLLQPIGQFGTRLAGGSDAASSRYIHTKLSKITDFIYRSEDEPILTYVNEDGVMAEPEFYIPIIPMILVNGSEGIGTGFSSKILPYNPKDIVANIKRLMNGKSLRSMTPWFRGFQGTIKKISGQNYELRGNYQLISDNTLQIIELPVGEWTTPYKEYLETWAFGEDGKKKEFVQDIYNYSTDITIDFHIKFIKGMLNEFMNEDDIMKKLHLNKKVSCTNMHVHHNKKIVKFDTPEEIMREFYSVRLEYYNKRKEYQLKQLLADIKLLENKVRFVRQIINKEIVIFNKKKEEIYTILEEQKYMKVETNGYDYLLRMAIYSLTQEKVNELEDLLRNKQTLYDYLLNKSIIDIWTEELDEFLEEYENFEANPLTQNE